MRPAILWIALTAVCCACSGNATESEQQEPRGSGTSDPPAATAAHQDTESNADSNTELNDDGEASDPGQTLEGPSLFDPNPANK